MHLASFHSLGSRHTKLFRDSTKNTAFEEAVQNALFLLSRNGDKGAKDVPSLIHDLFDRTKIGPDYPELEQIRDAMRPNYKPFSSHDLSATGTKILAYLAYLHNPEACYKDEGTELDHANLQKMITSFFAQGQAPTLHPDALKDMKLKDNGSREASSYVLQFGKGRWEKVFQKKKDTLQERGLFDPAHLELMTGIGEIFKAREEREKNEIRKRIQEIPPVTCPELTIDFTQKPKLDEKLAAQIEESQEVVLGDMHGNPLLLLHQLVQTGFLKIKPGVTDTQWKAFSQAIKNKDFEPSTFRNPTKFRDFSVRLGNIFHLGPSSTSSKKLILAGDLLADRAYHDGHMLSIFHFLQARGVNYEIIFSNHDAAFLNYYFVNKDKAEGEGYVIPSNDNIPPDKKASLEALHTSLNQDPTLRAEFKKMVEEVYLPHLKLLDLSEDGKILYTHGIMTKSIFEELQRASGLDPETPLPLPKTIEHINKWFHKEVLKDRKNFESHALENLNKPIQSPVYQLIWNMANIQIDKGTFHLVGRETFSKEGTRLPLLPPHPSIENMVHGHTPDPPLLEHITVLRDVISSSEENLLALSPDPLLNSLGDLQDLAPKINAIHKILSDIPPNTINMPPFNLRLEGLWQLIHHTSLDILHNFIIRNPLQVSLDSEKTLPLSSPEALTPLILNPESSESKNLIKIIQALQNEFQLLKQETESLAAFIEAHPTQTREQLENLEAIKRNHSIDGEFGQPLPVSEGSTEWKVPDQGTRRIVIH